MPFFPCTASVAQSIIRQITLWAVTVASATLAFVIAAYRLDAKLHNRRQGRPDGMVEISGPANPKFDIVVVHGLGADPSFSWTWKVSKRELEDLAKSDTISTPVQTALKEEILKFEVNEKTRRISLLNHVLKPEFPDARILSFCYNSDWFINAPVVTAQQIGNRLSRELVKVRSTHLSTPIIFIGHSFGGIVIKEALLAAMKDAKEDMVDSTYGIVFLGTPHYGSSSSRLAIFLAWVSGGLGSDNTLLFFLRKCSPHLSDLEKAFRKLVIDAEGRKEKLQIASFCETMPTRYFGIFSLGRIVDPSSAQGCASQIYEADLNHVDLNKNPKIYRELTDVLRNLNPQSEPSLNPTQLHILENLKPLERAKFDPNRQKFDKDETMCYPGTRVALLQKIQEWATDEAGKCIFWLQGKAGAGKSTISRTITSKLLREKCFIASFFFQRNPKDGDDPIINSVHLFPTIAAQIVQYLPSVAVHVRKKIDDANNRTAIAMGSRKFQFEKLILEPLQEAEKNSRPPINIIVVIDALDECDQNDNVEDILRVLTCVTKLKFFKVKFLVTSRPENDIRNRMNLNDEFKSQLEGTQLDEEPATENDISVYMRSRLEKVRENLNRNIGSRSQKLPADWPGEHKTTELVKMAVPLFIFAVTVCRFIEDQRLPGTPSNRLERVLQQKVVDHETRIEATYLPVLQQMFLGLKDAVRAESIHEFKAIIGPIAVLSRPLSVESLATLLDISIEIADKRLNWLHSVLNVPSDPQTPITFFHQSFRDFLLSDELAKDFSVNMTEMHEKLQSKCHMIMKKSLKKDVCCQMKPGTLRKNVDKQVVDGYLKPEIQYACLYWVEHLQKSDHESKDGDEVHEFLQSHLLYWLEALGWMGRILDGIHAMASLESFIAAKECPQLSRFVYDIKRFIDKNRVCIENAPLQVHCSALVFAPEESMVRKQFENCIPPWICQRPKVEKYWGDLLQTIECHSKKITALAFSQHGNQLASALYDDTIRVWDLMTGAVKLLQGHEDSIEAIAFSQDSKQLASASIDETVRLWDLTSTNPEVKSFEGLEWLWDDFIIIAQDGMHLAQVSAANDRLKVGYLTSDYNLETNLANVDIRDPKCVAFSQDGRQLAVACRESITLWNLTSQPFTKRPIPGDHDYIDENIALAFSEDGRQLACFDHMGILRLWDLISCSIQQECIRRYSSSGACTITFSSDDKQLAVALRDEAIAFRSKATFRDETIEIWDLTSKPLKRRKVLRTPVSRIFTMAFSKDGKQLASAGEDGMIRLHDLTADFDSKAGSPKSQVEGLGFSQNGRQLMSFMHDGTLRLLDSETGQDIETVESGGNLLLPRYVTSQMNQKVDWNFNSDSKEMVVRVWNLTSDPIRKRKLALPLSPEVEYRRLDHCVATSHDGEQLAWTLTKNLDPGVRTVALWDLTHNPVKTKQFEVLGSGQWHGPLFSPDGKKLAFHGDSILVSDLISNPVQQRFIFEEAGLPPSLISGVTFSHDGNQLVSIEYGGMITLWDLTFNPVQTKEVGRHNSLVKAIALSPRSEQLALTTYDGRLKLWDLTSSTPTKPKKFHFGVSFEDLSFSCTGKYFDTNRGQFSLPSNATHDSSNISPLILVKESWVSKDGEDILWLPDEHRSKYVAVHESMLGYVSVSGQIFIIKFDFSEQID